MPVVLEENENQPSYTEASSPGGDLQSTGSNAVYAMLFL
jgi:hypothetical protein